MRAWLIIVYIANSVTAKNVPYNIISAIFVWNGFIHSAFHKINYNLTAKQEKLRLVQQKY